MRLHRHAGGGQQQRAAAAGTPIQRTAVFSSTAMAVTAVLPRMVPRIVWGRRNFQNASLKATIFWAADGSGSCSGGTAAMGAFKMLTTMHADHHAGGTRAPSDATCMTSLAAGGMARTSAPAPAAAEAAISRAPRRHRELCAAAANSCRCCSGRCRRCWRHRTAGDAAWKGRSPAGAAREALQHSRRGGQLVWRGGWNSAQWLRVALVTAAPV